MSDDEVDVTSTSSSDLQALKKMLAKNTYENTLKGLKFILIDN
jgi:uncharacterized protein YajQ (UPF0234 family)